MVRSLLLAQKLCNHLTSKPVHCAWCHGKQIVAHTPKGATPWGINLAPWLLSGYMIMLVALHLTNCGDVPRAQMSPRRPSVVKALVVVTMQPAIQHVLLIERVHFSVQK